MKLAAPRVVNLLLDFGDRLQARSHLDRMSRAAGRAMNIVRGRLTPDQAHYEIRLRGSRRTVGRALRLCRGEGIDLRVNGP
ncbi:MAG TPA: hypothetical protein VFC86_10335 [Planctomycetota bacterium]|nr:hypothetical protein [Planctomycetota bacterium]